MKYFAIPALDPESAERDLNQFLAQHRIVSLKNKLVREPGGSYWAVSVTYQESQGGKPQQQGRKKVDYMEILPREDFVVFAELRQLRKQFASKEGVPPYRVFTDQQLAALVQRRVRTPSQMEAVSGVGPATVEKYGDAFIARLIELQESRSHAKNDDPT